MTDASANVNLPGVTNENPNESNSDKPEPRGCLPTLLVFLAMILIVGSGAVAAEAVAGLPSRPVNVARDITIAPAGEWEFGGRTDDDRGILLSKGSVSLVVSVQDRAASPEAALEALFDDWQSESDAPLAVGPVSAIDLRPGQAAVRASYSGTFEGIGYPVEGEVTVIQGAQATVIFDAWAGFGDFVLSRAEIDQMTREASIP
ncbi:MAG: hypothetical protein M3452_06430 [Chloroflexota bacterium]|nr:hypothetical protein [Chloroflexota bacterium]